MKAAGITIREETIADAIAIAITVPDNVSLVCEVIPLPKFDTDEPEAVTFTITSPENITRVWDIMHVPEFSEDSIEPVASSLVSKFNIAAGAESLYLGAVAVLYIAMCFASIALLPFTIFMGATSNNIDREESQEIPVVRRETSKVADDQVRRVSCKRRRICADSGEKVSTSFFDIS